MIKKFFLILIAGFLTSFFVLPNLSIQAEASENEILNNLQTKCYEPAKKNFDEKMANLSGSAMENFDPTQFPEFQQMFGNEAGLDISEFNKAIENLVPGMENKTKEEMVALSQINIDLASCYEKELSGSPDLLTNAKKLSIEAQQQLNLAQNFNYDQLFATGKKATSVVSIPAKERKVFRLLTFCLDGDRPAPNTGENYYLAGSADNVKDGLSSMVKSAQTGNINTIQENIWKNKIETVKETSNSSNQPIKESNRNLTLGLIGFGGLGFLSVLILGIARLKTFSLLGKIFWTFGLVTTVSLGVVGGLQIMGNSLGVLPQSISGPATLQKAFEGGDITILVISPGTISSLDLIVQNNTGKKIEIDTSGIYFIPTSDNFSEGHDSNNEGDSDSNVSDDSNDGSNDESRDNLHRSQRLASAGSTGDGPPYPPSPPDPDKVLEDLSKKTDSALKKAIEDLKNNPTEENLKEAIDKLGDCQLVGCPSGDDSLDDIADAYQPKIDKDTQAYKDNPNAENRRNLIKSTELGQAVGANTAAAEGALGF